MSHRFVTTPLPESRQSRSPAFYGRVVVLVVIASVIAVASIAYTVSEVFSVDRQPVPLQEWFIGSWGGWSSPMSDRLRNSSFSHSSALPSSASLL